MPHYKDCLPRLSKPVSLIQLYAITPASLLICNNPCLVQLCEVIRPPVQLYVRNMMSSQGASVSPSEIPDHLLPAALSVHVFVCLTHSLPPNQAHPWNYTGVAGSLQREAEQESLLSNCGVPRAAVDWGCSDERSICSHPPSAYSLSLLCVFTIQL